MNPQQAIHELPPDCEALNINFGWYDLCGWIKVTLITYETNWAVLTIVNNKEGTLLGISHLQHSYNMDKVLKE